MSKANSNNTIHNPNRRHAIAIAAGALASAATAISLAVAATTPKACHDPASEAHRAAAARFDIEHAKLVAAGPDADWHAAQAALDAEWQAAKVLAATVPTTQVGREALQSWLSDARSRLIRYAA